ncbi:MAG: cation:proton antiporter domain-containing protein, partial [Chitinophaga sp.]
PNGFNVLSRDSSVVVTGTTGLLYIMFLAGLEINMGDFKRNKWKSITFSIYTFAAPFALGFSGGYYLLGFSLFTSVLFASLFSSHTLIGYPLISKLGIARNRAVNITVGGTMITDVLSLMVLAVIVGMTQGEVDSTFWTKLSISMVLFGLTVLLVFPLIGRWFFKSVDDKISQYIFVLVMIYLAALLAEIAGIEAIIGAFFAGLALNRLIPQASSLMNRIEFIGNAIFIPFFLISVGMLIDFSVFLKSWETLTVAGIMLVASIGGKYLAAVATRKTFRLSKDEGMLIFGMSSASAAATLASVMVGYNIIVSETAAGEPVRLLNEHVLNGSILLILISCTISSFTSMSSAQRIAEEEKEDTIAGTRHETENILLAVNHEETVERMVNLGLLLKSKGENSKLFALNVINESQNESSKKNAEKTLNHAVHTAASADIPLQSLVRYDNDVVNGINSVVKEQNITDLIIGLEDEKGFSPSFIYNLYYGYLTNPRINVLVYHAAQPVSTVKRYVVFIPENAEKEAGFFHALLKIWNIGRNSGVRLTFHTTQKIIGILDRIIKKSSLEAEFKIARYWQEIEEAASAFEEDEGLIVFMSKAGSASYFPQMKTVPEFLNRHLHGNNYLLIFPFSEMEDNLPERRSISNHRDFAEISNIIGRMFK